MGSNIQLVKSIEIRYLRSIHNLRIGTLGNLTGFSGANDIDKSNILKALNLFFNDEVDRLRPLEFYQDFSLLRLHEVRNTIKDINMRKFIETR